MQAGYGTPDNRRIKRVNKRIAGKWYKKESGETVNIFDETPLRMKMSVPSGGYYNFEPNCVYEKDGYFCFEIDDEHNCMVYYLRYENGGLSGFYTGHGKKTPVRYEKLSDTPENLPYCFSPAEKAA